MPTMTDLGKVLTAGIEEPRRVEFKFDPQTLKFTGKGSKGVTLLHYVDRPAKTPTGGRYTRRAMTIRYSGEKWVGTMRKDSNLVKFRPYSEAVSK